MLEVNGGSLPERDMLPFARRQDCDTVVGFVVDAGEVREAVIEVHLTYRGGPEILGYPQVRRFASFWEWLSQPQTTAQTGAAKKSSPTWNKHTMNAVDALLQLYCQRMTGPASRQSAGTTAARSFLS